MTSPGTILERFTARYIVDPASGCWLWTAGSTGNGYGKFSPAHTDQFLAHRWAYEHFVGPIPDGLTIDHLCRTRRCVNPSHLEAVTMRENVLRGDTITAAAAARTHCPRGHAYDAANTQINRAGARVCRACLPITQKASRDRKRGYEAVAPSARTHCPQNHPYDAENTYHYKGERHCRICRNEAAARSRAKRAAR